jgi:hypothetical protein
MSSWPPSWLQWSPACPPEALSLHVYSPPLADAGLVPSAIAIVAD